MTKKVAEPAIAYNSSYVQGLKNRIIASIDQTNDEEKLEQCLEILEQDDMLFDCSDNPYTLEELRMRIDKAEADINDGRVYTTKELDQQLKKEFPWLM